MAIVPVPGMRTIVGQGSDGLFFEIPARRQWFAIFFLPVWLVGWVLGEGFAITTLLSGDGPSLFMIIWLCAWTAGGAFAAGLWLWMLAGRERVTLRADRLVHRHELFGLGRGREYALSNVRNLRVSPESFSAWTAGAGLRMWGFGGGVVAFDYGAKTMRFAAAVDEAEGQMIVDRIKERYPIPA